LISENRRLKASNVRLIEELRVTTTASEGPVSDPVETALLQIFEGAETEGGRTLHLSDIKVRPVRWLWQDRMPLGALTPVGGREGIGKTLCCYTLAADITRGRLAGTYQHIPRSVIVAATEDSWEHTIVPRLMAAGANLDPWT
jgi:hypothetical protein